MYLLYIDTYKMLQGGWLPEQIEFGRTRIVRRRGVDRTIPNVRDFLETIPRIRSEAGQNAILRKFWDVQGYLVDPDLSKANIRYVKAYAKELMRHMTPTTKAQARQGRRTWMVAKKRQYPAGYRRGRAAKEI